MGTTEKKPWLNQLCNDL